jgi:hypothetical protein
MRKIAYGVMALLVAGGCAAGSSQLVPTLAQSSILSDGATAVYRLAWGTLPPAAAGTAFAKPAVVKLTAFNSRGKPIRGAYLYPIHLGDNDATGATHLYVNGKPASKTNLVRKSSDVVSLSYTGLAISPATLSAKGKGVKKPASAPFAPAAAAITYTGPLVSSKPEIDLDGTVPGTGAYSGAFTATQSGWSGSPFDKPFTYAFAAVAGKTNDCPGTAGAAYTISPASGTAGTAFTVTATANPAAGACALTITGAGGKTIGVTLTFTTTNVSVNTVRQ